MAFNNRVAGGVLNGSVHVTAPPSLGTCHTSFHSFHLILWFSFRLTVALASRLCQCMQPSNLCLLPPFIIFLTLLCLSPFHSVFPSSHHSHHSHQSRPFQISTELVYLPYWENRDPECCVKDFFFFFCEMKKKINAKINWLCKSQDCHALNWLWMIALCAIFNGPLFKLHTYIFWF